MKSPPQPSHRQARLPEKLFKPSFPLFLHPLLPSLALLALLALRRLTPPTLSSLPPTEVISLPPLVAGRSLPSVHPRLLISVIPSISFNVGLTWFLSLSRGFSPESNPPFVFSCLLRFSSPLFLPLQQQRQPPPPHPPSSPCCRPVSSECLLSNLVKRWRPADPPHPPSCPNTDWLLPTFVFPPKQVKYFASK